MPKNNLTKINGMEVSVITRKRLCSKSTIWNFVEAEDSNILEHFIPINTSQKRQDDNQHNKASLALTSLITHNKI